ncbi:MAG: HD domain-containing phosphohydrolase [Thermodesulfobacteriota bacterium]
MKIKTAEVPSVAKAVKKPLIPIADDDLFFRELFQDLLQKMNYDTVTVSDGSEALSEAFRLAPDIIITDVVMPDLNGFELTGKLKSDRRTMYTPVIIATSLSDSEARIKGLRSGADDTLSKPVDETELYLRVRNLLKIKKYEKYLIEHGKAIEGEIRSKTVALEEAYEQIKNGYLDTVTRLTLAAEYRDKDTGAHIKRISLYSQMLAEKRGLSAAEVDAIFKASPMHDVGKIGIPDKILLKKGRFTDKEFTVMKTHCDIGANILHNPGPVVLQTAMDIALNHHERWDGSGYPGARGKTDIPVSARIVHIVDMYDALRSKRPYKPAFDQRKTMDIMENRENYGFDPELYRLFSESAGEFNNIFTANQGQETS